MAKKVEVSPVQFYSDLKIHVERMEEDVEKFGTGNKAAGRRLRKALQDLKKNIKPWRDGIMEAMKS